MSIKKIISLCICTAIIISIAGCEDNSATGNRQTGNAVSVESILEQTPTPTPTLTPTMALEPSPEPVLPGADEEGIDVDLTQLSSTMVYSEVYNMVFYPEKYIGKTVKMSGSYMVFHDDGTDKYYHACIISDATACCAQGIEFELAGDNRYPDDYPQIGESVCVEGTFDIYWEGEEKYCTLRNARIV